MVDDNFNELEKSILQGLQEAVLYKRGQLTELDGLKIHSQFNSSDTTA